VELFELLKALVIGIVEGITEWLPISSTGHMILADEFIKLSVSPEFLKMFLVVIQLGAIMAVILLYFHRLNPFSPRKDRAQKRQTLGLWAKVIVACVPAAIIGFLLDDWMEEHVYNAVTVSIALVVYGVAFIVVERFKGADAGLVANAGAHASLGAGAGAGADADKGRGGTHFRSPASTPLAPAPAQIDSIEDLSFVRVLGIGVFQCLAIVPGTSRSGSTILGGLILGVSRTIAAEFSFFLAIPVMFGWSLLKVVKAFVLDHLVLTATEWGVLVAGVLVAFAVSVAAIKFLMGFIKNHSFAAFGWYRIVLGLVVLAYFVVTGTLF